MVSNSAPYQSHSETSREAAAAIQDRIGQLQRRILLIVRSSGKHGHTADEIQTMGFDGSTVRPRLLELQRKRLIIKTERTRLTRSKRRANVYIAVTPGEPLPEPAAKTKLAVERERVAALTELVKEIAAKLPAQDRELALGKLNRILNPRSGSFLDRLRLKMKTGND